MTPRKSTRTTARKRARATARTGTGTTAKKSATKPARTSGGKARGRPAAKSAKRTGRSRVSTSGAGSVEGQLEAIERDGGTGDVALGRGVTLHVSSLDKVYFPDAGVTKGALMRYYARVAPLLLPHLA